MSAKRFVFKEDTAERILKAVAKVEAMPPPRKQIAGFVGTRDRGGGGSGTDSAGQYIGTHHTTVAANTGGWDFDKLVTLP
jgi:hypothetical protein